MPVLPDTPPRRSVVGGGETASELASLVVATAEPISDSDELRLMDDDEYDDENRILLSEEDEEDDDIVSTIQLTDAEEIGGDEEEAVREEEDNISGTFVVESFYVEETTDEDENDQYYDYGEMTAIAQQIPTTMSLREDADLLAGGGDYSDHTWGEPRQRKRAEFISATLHKPLKSMGIGATFASRSRDTGGLGNNNNHEIYIQEIHTNEGDLLAKEGCPFQPGDVILSINNQRISYSSGCSGSSSISPADVEDIFASRCGWFTIVVQNVGGDANLVESMVEKTTPNDLLGVRIQQYTNGSSNYTSNNKVVVTFIDPSKNVVHSLLNVGDEVLSVNGISCYDVHGSQTVFMTGPQVSALIGSAPNFVTIVAKTQRGTGVVVGEVSIRPSNTRTVAAAQVGGGGGPTTTRTTTIDANARRSNEGRVMAVACFCFAVVIIGILVVVLKNNHNDSKESNNCYWCDDDDHDDYYADDYYSTGRDHYYTGPRPTARPTLGSWPSYTPWPTWAPYDPYLLYPPAIYDEDRPAPTPPPTFSYVNVPYFILFFITDLDSNNYSNQHYQLYEELSTVSERKSMMCSTNVFLRDRLRNATGNYDIQSFVTDYTYSFHKRHADNTYHPFRYPSDSNGGQLIPLVLQVGFFFNARYQNNNAGGGGDTGRGEVPHDVIVSAMQQVGPRDIEAYITEYVWPVGAGSSNNNSIFRDVVAVDFKDPESRMIDNEWHDSMLKNRLKNCSSSMETMAAAAAAATTTTTTMNITQSVSNNNNTQAPTTMNNMTTIDSAASTLIPGSYDNATEGSQSPNDTTATLLSSTVRVQFIGQRSRVKKEEAAAIEEAISRLYRRQLDDLLPKENNDIICDNILITKASLGFVDNNDGDNTTDNGFILGFVLEGTCTSSSSSDAAAVCQELQGNPVNFWVPRNVISPSNLWDIMLVEPAQGVILKPCVDSAPRQNPPSILDFQVALSETIATLINDGDLTNIEKSGFVVEYPITTTP